MLKLSKDNLSTWVLGLVLLDLAIGLGFLGLIQGLSDPAFGPPLWLKAWSAAFEAGHLPLGLYVLRAQADLGFLGIFSQGWDTPVAQLVRLFIFAANTALVATAIYYLQPGRKGAPTTHTLGLQPLLGAALRDTLFQGRPWRGIPGSARDRAQWIKGLEEMEWLLGKLDLRAADIKDARARALYFVGQAGEDARSWLVLGQATLAVAEAGQAVPDEEGVAFGRACLRRAWTLAPENVEAWKALLQWRVLPLETLKTASTAVLRGLGSLAEIWALSLSPLPAEEKVAQWEARWLHASESLRLRAETLEAAGQSERALPLWRLLLGGASSDQRWQRHAVACLRSLGLAENQWYLPLPAKPPLLEPQWLYPRTRSLAKKAPLLARAGRGLLLLVLLCLPIRPVQLLSNTLFKRAIWTGHWRCSAILSPFGQEIQVGSFPFSLHSYLREEACGYTSITSLAPHAAMTLTEDGGKDVSLEQSYDARWSESPWGVTLQLKGRAEGGTLILRDRDPGIEMSIPCQSWTLYFVRDEQAQEQPTAEVASGWPVARWMRALKRGSTISPPRKEEEMPPVYETWRGVYVDLKERGWALVGSTAQDLPIYSGMNMDGFKPMLAEAVIVVPQVAEAKSALGHFSFSASKLSQSDKPSQGGIYTLSTSDGSSYSPGGAQREVTLIDISRQQPVSQSPCGGCSRPSACSSALIRRVDPVRWMNFD